VTEASVEELIVPSDEVSKGLIKYDIKRRVYQDMGMTIMRQEAISNIEEWLGDIRTISKKQFANVHKLQALREYQNKKSAAPVNGGGGYAQF